jgi:hypothetical protein
LKTKRESCLYDRRAEDRFLVAAFDSSVNQHTHPHIQNWVGTNEASLPKITEPLSPLARRTERETNPSPVSNVVVEIETSTLSVRIPFRFTGRGPGVSDVEIIYI